MNQWITGSAINESVNQWTIESLNPWSHESMNQWLGDGWVDGWMDGRMGMLLFLLSYFFIEWPLCWGTSSLSHFLLQPWAASQLYSSFAASALRAGVTMCLAASSCNPAWHTRSTMVKNYLSCSYYDAFSNFQAAILFARSVAASPILCRAQPFQCVFVTRRCKPAKQERHNQIDQRPRRAGNGDGSALLRLRQSFVKSSSRYSAVHILPTSSSKSAPNVTVLCDFEVQIVLSLQPLCAFCWQLLQIEACPRKQGPYFRDPRGHITRKKTQCFTGEFTRFRTLTLPKMMGAWNDDDVVDMMIWGWHDEVVDMMVGMLTTTIVRNSEVV